MATLEERVQTLEQEIAARKQAEEMLTIAVRALVSKEAFEQLQETIEASQEQNGRLFNVLINQGALHNERMTNLQGQIIDLDGNVNRLQTDVKGLQTDVKGLQTDVKGLQTDVKGLQTDVKGLQTEMRETRGDMTDVKSIAQQILARLPEEPSSS
jgi:chromosome segregation ATPase